VHLLAVPGQIGRDPFDELRQRGQPVSQFSVVDDG